jgi:UTP--glucose-1-phosphate uridylyltransferase
MTQLIKKAIFPVAGMGTRFLPATKANPKEMLPIVDKPLIQYAVEEAVACGITELIFVTSSSKRAIEDHFDTNFELESKLTNNGKQELLNIVRGILPKGVSCAYIRQPEALGLGHAVLCAKPIIADEPFAVLLADDLIEGDHQNCLQQMADIYQETHQSVIAVQQIPHEETDKYGIIAGDGISNNIIKIKSIIEKPAINDAPSNLGVVGRYIFTPAIFDFLERTPAGRSGEIQLTDAIARLLLQEPVRALRFRGKRYDCGTKLGYLEATVAYALKHTELATEFKRYLQNITLDYATE